MAIDKSKNFYSIFMQINASFIHFVVFQLIALIVVYFLKYNSFGSIYSFLKEYFVFYDATISALYILKNAFYALGFFLFIYSIFTMLATVFGIFRISFWIDSQNRSIAKSEHFNKCPDCYGDVPPEAKKCMHCGCEFETVNSQSKPS